MDPGNGINPNKYFTLTLFKSTPGGDRSGGGEDALENDKFLVPIRQAGYRVNLIPVLTFRFSNLDQLWKHIRDYEKFSGILFTSPRCVQSIAQAVELHDDPISPLWSKLRQCWAERKIYCVGPSTLESAKDLLHMSIENPNLRQSKAGNAESLGQLIVEECGQCLPLLYPCGTLKRPTLPDMMSANKILFELVTVYATEPNPELEKYIRLHGICDNGFKSQGTQVYVFFSPSGLKFCLPFIKQVSHLKFVAIGPTTKSALENVEIIPSRSIYQCEAPTPEALLHVLEHVSQSIKS